MKKYRLYQVDSFTRERFHGNPAGVVPNADGLTDDQMQRIAREMNNSETAFIFQSDDPVADVEVRFFTPSTEVPLCGHATIAAHYVRAIEGSAVSGRVMQKTKAGILPVDIVRDSDDFSIVMTQGTPEVSVPFEEPLVRRIAEALGIDRKDMRGDCPVAVASAGHSKIMVGINSEPLLHSLRPNMDQLAVATDTMSLRWIRRLMYLFTAGCSPRRSESRKTLSPETRTGRWESIWCTLASAGSWRRRMN